jgi:cellulose synthase/poly-beta-1,6-N-acetylglucosamine synthase-like glycosyltransferase
LALVLDIVSLVLLILTISCSLYGWIFVIASMRRRSRAESANLFRRNRFAIAIPAHNEESVIAQTVTILRQQNYPADLFDIFVGADFCSDKTAEQVRTHGAQCFERNAGDRSGKGAALRWLFERIFERETTYDAVVIFDADTRVDPGFLGAMDARLNEGSQVIQGRHVISNPRAGWFPALTWAMMTIDNRYNNQGRANLKLSAKHMGDSICFRSAVLKKLGWGSGLTEDYEFRLRLLLDGIKIDYEPAAVGYGQAPLTWSEAQAQRLRWAKGMAQAREHYRNQLLREGLRQGDWSKLDGALGASIPSYSTLSLIAFAMLLLHLAFGSYGWSGFVYLWGALALGLFIYPLFGLMLEKSPWWAYLAILSGPFFMLWRTWLNLRVRVARQAVSWVRTPHRG